jgi:predicted SnoaL-like aldol condensation-catalyzing enzyme
MTRALLPVALAFALLGMVFVGTARGQDATPAAGDTEAVARQFVEAMNTAFSTGETTALDDVVAADYVNHTPSPTQSGATAAPDLAGLKESFGAVHEVFPDAKVSVKDAIVEGDQAALLIDFTGMRGMESDTDGVIVVRVVDGKIAESWNFQSGGAAGMQPMFEATPSA